MGGLKLEHKDDFDQVYDLDDPRPYFRGLAPGDYRMPGVLVRFLKLARARIATARNRETPLRIADF